MSNTEPAGAQFHEITVGMMGWQAGLAWQAAASLAQVNPRPSPSRWPAFCLWPLPWLHHRPWPLPSVSVSATQTQLHPCPCLVVLLSGQRVDEGGGAALADGCHQACVADLGSLEPLLGSTAAAWQSSTTACTHELVGLERPNMHTRSTPPPLPHHEQHAACGVSQQIEGVGCLHTWWIPGWGLSEGGSPHEKRSSINRPMSAWDLGGGGWGRAAGRAGV